jgi:hypothetical protein
MGPPSNNKTYLGEIALEFNSNYDIVENSLKEANLGSERVIDEKTDLKFQLNRVVREAVKTRGDYEVSINEALGRLKDVSLFMTSYV